MTSRRKNILMLVSNAFDPDPRVQREAAALVQSGYHVTILCWDRDLKSIPSACIDGIYVERIRIASTHGRGVVQLYFLMLFWLLAFSRALRKKFDIIHAHDFDTLPLGYILSRCRKAKLVYDAHESYVGMLHSLPELLKRSIYHTETWMLKRTDLVITVGEILRSHLLQRGAIKAAVVGNWQDPELFRFNNGDLDDVRRRLQIKADRTVLCYIAHLGNERQVPQLIEAVRRSPRVHLVLGGNGPCREMALEAANQSENISYLGLVDPDLIPLYTAASDAVFYGFDPAYPNANFSAPNKLFEALAAGKPILTCNFGEIGNIVSSEGCGIILPDYSVESIESALQELRTPAAVRMSDAARKLGETQYNWPKARSILLKEYEIL
jgi:glycosyltransferase involved in cell wall biosynthesis